LISCSGSEDGETTIEECNNFCKTYSNCAGTYLNVNSKCRCFQFCDLVTPLDESNTETLRGDRFKLVYRNVFPHRSNANVYFNVLKIYPELSCSDLPVDTKIIGLTDCLQTCYEESKTCTHVVMSGMYQSGSQNSLLVGTCRFYNGCNVDTPKFDIYNATTTTTMYDISELYQESSLTNRKSNFYTTYKIRDVVDTNAPTEMPTTGSPTLKPTTGSPTLKPSTGSPTLKPTTAPPGLIPTTGSPTTGVLTSMSPTTQIITSTPTYNVAAPSLNNVNCALDCKTCSGWLLLIVVLMLFE